MRANSRKHWGLRWCECSSVTDLLGLRWCELDDCGFDKLKKVVAQCKPSECKFVEIHGGVMWFG